MNFSKNYYEKTIKYELLNKFNYKNINNIPKIKKIVLNLGCKGVNMKLLAHSLLALELITAKQGMLSVSKKSNLLLKIRKSNPVGCYVNLKKNYIFDLIEKLLVEVFPKMKNTNDLNFNLTKKNFKSTSHTINNPLLFSELEHNYYLFNNISNIQITILTNSNNLNETTFLLHALKFNLNKRQM